MRGSSSSLEALAVAARDVAFSPSPSKPNPASMDINDMMRYERINPESVPVPNGGGSGSSATRKPAEHAPSLTPSKDELAPAVDADSSSLASYLARASLEQRRPRGRPASSSAAIVSDHQLYNAAAHSSQGPNLEGGLYNLAAQAAQAPNLDGGLYNLAAQAAQVPNLDGGLYNLAAQAAQVPNLDGGVYNFAAQAAQAFSIVSGGVYNFAAQASQGPDFGGGSSSSDIAIAAPDDPAPLKWGHKKRSRARREPHAPPAPSPAPAPAPAPVPTPTPAPEPELTSAQAARRRAILRIKNRPAAQGQSQPLGQAEKLMPPPSARGPVIRDTSPLTPRAATLSQHRSSAEDSHAAAGEQQQPAAKWEPKPQPQASGSGEQVQQPAPKEEPNRQQRPRRQASAKAAHTTAEEEPAPKVEPRQPTPQRQQPRRQASMKDKGKAPMVPERPAVPPHIAARAAAAAAAAVEAVARPPLPRVVTQLTRKEKEEDWFAMTGGRLPYRPQRRPKAVERDLHDMFPGQGLWEVTRTRYMVRGEKKPKKRGGLQALAEEDDSD